MKILLLIELLKPKIRNLQIRHLQELDFHLSVFVAAISYSVKFLSNIFIYMLLIYYSFSDLYICVVQTS